jgi:hypothetical protein
MPYMPAAFFTLTPPVSKVMPLPTSVRGAEEEASDDDFGM